MRRAAATIVCEASAETLERGRSTCSGAGTLDAPLTATPLAAGGRTAPLGAPVIERAKTRLKTVRRLGLRRGVLKSA